MSKLSQGIPVKAIYDIGKTNKKFLLFNRQFDVVFESSAQFKEIQDEDGEPCEDLSALTKWIKGILNGAHQNPEFKIEAVNFSTYRASFVHLDSTGKPSMAVLNNQPMKSIFVDGGFSKNDFFMNMLARKFKKLEVYSTSVAQASALGAAKAIQWQPENSLLPFPIKRYPT